MKSTRMLGAMALVGCIAAGVAGYLAGAGRIGFPVTAVQAERGLDRPNPQQVEQPNEDSADLRGRVVALEAIAERLSETVEVIVKRLPPLPPTAEEVVARVAGMAHDIADSVVLPYIESAGDTSQPPVLVLMDPRCPYCRAGHATTKALAAEGRARIVFMPIGLLGPNSKAASVAILAMSALDAKAGADLIDIFFGNERAVDEPAIAAGVAAELAKIGRPHEDYAAALAAGEVAHERIQKAYETRNTNSGIPVYVRLAGGTLRGTIGFANAATLRQQLGF